MEVTGVDGAYCIDVHVWFLTNVVAYIRSNINTVMFSDQRTMFSSQVV